MSIRPALDFLTNGPLHTPLYNRPIKEEEGLDICKGSERKGE